MSVFRFGTVLLAGAATLAFSSTAHAAGASRQEKIDALQQQINDLNAEVADLKRSTSDQYTDVVQKQGDKPDVAVSLKNGRPAFKSADGDFSLEIRSLVQFDAAYYGQGKSPAGVDFSSGANFRRARLGVDGTLFKDWSYECATGRSGARHCGRGWPRRDDDLRL